MVNWKYTIDISSHARACKAGEITPAQYAGKIAELIRKKFDTQFIEDDSELSDVLEAFTDFTAQEDGTNDQLDDILDDFYNWADTPLSNTLPIEKLCWIQAH